MRFGCAWYPEQWSESRWAADLALMRDAHMNVVRVGEFAWSRMEPSEGRYDLDWLERAIHAAASHGLATVIGTPTAAPPAWLTRRYPSTLLVRENGRPAEHGNRCHFSPTSERYIGFCRAIAGELARRFGGNEHVIGWQIDNEYSVVPYDEATRAQFHAFLRSRYGTIERINELWTTAYWSQTYEDWADIPLPIGPHNPGLMLEFRRFVSRIYASYQSAQIEAIRPHTKGFITHNALGWFEAVDLDELVADLDVASWDCYAGTGHFDPLAQGVKHDLVRGLKGRSFWLMETQPGSVNWSHINSALNRGAVGTMCWHAVGHGADAILFWQWRSALNGQEQYHGSLVAPDGRPRPVYDEIRRLGGDLARTADALRGTGVISECALIDSYDDRWALQLQRHHADFDPGAHTATFYRALRSRLHAIDVVHPTRSLAGYRLVIAPHLHLCNEALAAKLERFVREGGHLVLGPRSGMKDEHSALLPSRQPGPLAAALGAHVEEYYALDAEVPLEPGGRASIWAEWIEVDDPDVTVVLRYEPSNGWLDGKAAVVSRALGAGSISYVGAWVDDETMGRLTDGWLEASGLSAWAGPPGVELCRRVGDSREVWICINHGQEPRSLDVPFSGVDRIGGERISGSLVLGPYGVAVVETRS
ncbi:MAG: beta-galactosidase [Myxococcales bacterium]|nr:beta-galactosidase [Myxococcales bacterium]